MSETYIVIFESKNNAQQIRNHLRSFNGWAKITNNAFAVMSTKTSSQIRDELMTIKGSGDRIFVIKSGVVAAWNNAAASSGWLKKNL